MFIKSSCLADIFCTWSTVNTNLRRFDALIYLAFAVFFFTMPTRPTSKTKNLRDTSVELSFSTPQEFGLCYAKEIGFGLFVNVRFALGKRLSVARVARRMHVEIWKFTKLPVITKFLKSRNFSIQILNNGRVTCVKQVERYCSLLLSSIQWDIIFSILRCSDSTPTKRHCMLAQSATHRSCTIFKFLSIETIEFPGFFFSNIPCLLAFLQQSALRTQDFTIYYRESIAFENPDRCGSAFSPDSVRKISCLFNAIFHVRKISWQQ